MSFKAVTFAVVLACTAIGSSALTLGKIRGAAWIGQPLDVVVSVSLEGSPADKNLCAEADVFHADNRQDNGRVRISTEVSEPGDAVNLRITSGALVDEPVVTLYVRAGCAQKTARRYVFLADVPDVSAQANTPNMEAPTPKVSKLPNPLDFAGPTIAGVIQARSAEKPEKSPKLAQTNAATRVKGKKSAPANTAQAERLAATKKIKVQAVVPADSDRPRLKLDPMDGLFAATPPAASPPAAAQTSAKPAAALAPIAAAGSASPTSAPSITLQESDGLSALNASIKAQLAQSAQSEALLLALRERLERAEAERVPLSIVYLLVALLTLSVAALGTLWWKRTRN